MIHEHNLTTFLKGRCKKNISMRTNLRPKY